MNRMNRTSMMMKKNYEKTQSPTAFKYRKNIKKTLENVMTDFSEFKESDIKCIIGIKHLK